MTSARNARLVAICQHVRTPAGGRVIESLASGIPIVKASLRDRGFPDPQFVDEGIRFTVLIRHRSPAAAIPRLTATQQRIWEKLVTPQDVATLQTELGLNPPTIRKALRELRQRGLVVQEGGPGRPTSYRRSAEPPA